MNEQDPTTHEPGPALEAVPLLGMVAMVAALLDMSLNGVAVRSLAQTLSHTALLRLSSWGGVPRNLAAIAGMVALPVALAGYLQSRRWVNVQRRLIIAGFAGIFLPIVLMAIVLSPEILPHDDRMIKLVKVGVGAANVLAVLLGLVAVRRPAPAGIRVGMALAVASCFFAFCALAVEELPFISVTHLGLVVGRSLRQLGELGYLATPMAVAFTVLPRPTDTRSRFALAVGAAATLVMIGLFTWGEVALRADFSVVLYGVQRLDLLSGPALWLYALPLGAGFGVSATVLAYGHEGRPQVGTALLLLLAAGYAPRAPGVLLTMVLGMALLSRASICFGERRLREGHEAVDGAAVGHLDASEP